LSKGTLIASEGAVFHGKGRELATRGARLVWVGPGQCHRPEGLRFMLNLEERGVDRFGGSQG
jgi:hypothetical protein